MQNSSGQFEVLAIPSRAWMPAFAGMTVLMHSERMGEPVIPAQAGIQQARMRV
jgi:hypothetical protein